MDRSDADRLELLDRIAEHSPLLVNGGGIDGGDGAFFANAGDGVHVVGVLGPIAPGYAGCVVIKPIGSRVLGRAVPDPLTHEPE